MREATQSYCLLAGGCVCPGVPADALSISQVDSPELFVGVGPSAGGGPQLSARSLGRWCQEVLVPAPPAGTLDPCLVGTWTTRSYVAPAAPGVEQTVTGGEGAVVELGADGAARVDMSATTPVVIEATDGSTTTTTLQYRGAGRGTWSAAEGVVDIAGVDTTTFTVGVRIETAAGVVLDEVLPANDVRLAGYAGLLGTGRYECTPVSLTIARVVPGVGDGAAGFELTP